MYFENEMPITRHMLDEILERLDGHCAIEDRAAVRDWYNQMPIQVSRHMLRDAMTVLMHGPDADTIASACYKTPFAFDRATRLMIELGAIWYIDLHGLGSKDADLLWDQLEEKLCDNVPCNCILWVAKFENGSGWHGSVSLEDWCKLAWGLRSVHDDDNQIINWLWIKVQDRA